MDEEFDLLMDRFNFIESAIQEECEQGRISVEDALKLLESELLAIGIEPDCSALWQALYRAREAA